MCGIVGYIGYREVLPILINGLKRLEYRGYDSAGIATYNDSGEIELIKSKGKVSVLEPLIKNRNCKKSSIGIGHTRWATHGVPNDVNSHPHISNSGNLVLVHNGIIENYVSLKELLSKRGYTFKSDTDTEVLVNLIEEIRETEKIKLGKAVQLALNQVIGAYGIVVFDKTNPDEVIVARLGSPLVIGVGVNKNEHFIASDVHPFIEYTNNIIYLEEGELAIVKDSKIKIRNIKDDKLKKIKTSQINIELEEIRKGSYNHFMHKEIHEQPRVIMDSLRGRLSNNSDSISMSGIFDNQEVFSNIKRIIILGCGSSYIAGLLGEYLIEDLAKIPVEVEYSSEFRYRNPIIYKTDLVVAISQSGETADTLAALKLVKKENIFTFGICNVVGSSISRLTDAGAYTHAGKEIGVASTKALMAQFIVIYLFAINIAQKRGTISQQKFNLFKKELLSISRKIETTLKLESRIKEIAYTYSESTNFLYLGRKYNYPMALEGALKLKEISYIHAEGYPAAEMKHGPIALIDHNMPVVVLANEVKNVEKIISNIQEIKARKGRVIGIVREGCQFKDLFDHIIEVPNTIDEFMPIISLIPLQLLAYHIAILKGKNVDQPRNLAKSVTVE